MAIIYSFLFILATFMYVSSFFSCHCSFIPSFIHSQWTFFWVTCITAFKNESEEERTCPYILALYFQQYTEILCGSNYHSPYGNGVILNNRPRAYKVGMLTEVNKLNVFFSKEILVANVPVIIFANIHLGEDLHTISSALILAVALLYQHITIGDRHDKRFFCILFE